MVRSPPRNAYVAADRIPCLNGSLPVATLVHTGAGCVGRSVARCRTAPSSSSLPKWGKPSLRGHRCDELERRTVEQNHRYPWHFVECRLADRAARLPRTVGRSSTAGRLATSGRTNDARATIARSTQTAPDSSGQRNSRKQAKASRGPLAQAVSAIAAAVMRCDPADRARPRIQPGSSTSRRRRASTPLRGSIRAIGH